MQLVKKMADKKMLHLIQPVVLKLTTMDGRVWLWLDAYELGFL
jgi:hypothetical protein